MVRNEAIEHNVERWTVVRCVGDPQGGLKQGTCTECKTLVDAEYDEHLWGEPSEKRADCDKNGGCVEYKCRLCPETREEPLEPGEHDWSAWEQIDFTSSDYVASYVRVCEKCRQLDPMDIHLPKPTIADEFKAIWEDLKDCAN